MASENNAWWVYLVQCADGTLYTGITTDTTRRLRQHNGDLSGGARYTASRRPVTLVFRQSCRNRSEASREEHRLRTLPRQQKLSLIH